MSSPSALPVFDVHSVHQDRLDRSQGWSVDNANTVATSQLAAGSMPSSPFPSTSPPSLNIYSFDQWSPVLNSDTSSDFNSCNSLGFPGSDPLFAYDSVSSSPSISTPTSSMASPLGDDSLLYLTSPDLLSHEQLSPFKASEVGGQDLIVPALPQQCHTIAWPLPTNISHSIPPAHNLHPPTPLSENLVPTDAPSIASQSLQGNLTGVPGGFIAPPTIAMNSALGLYYPDTTQNPESPLLSSQADGGASVPFVFTPAPPPQNWMFRAVDPAMKVSRTKPIQSDRTSSDHVLTTSTTDGVKTEPVIECGKCGYVQLTKRMGDFRRHLKKHEADHLSRVVCCGVPPTHPAAVRLRPGHLTHWYNGHLFYGGCGRSYSRMDALQRHLKKSGCIGGKAKDHQSWRMLYFRDKPAQFSVSSESQESSELSPKYSPPQASSSPL